MELNIAFLSAVLIGMIIHMYAILNNFLTNDSMWNLYSDQDMLSSARPLLQYACLPTSYYDLHFINGFVALIYLGIASVILVDLFQLKRVTSVILLAACVVGFPSMTSLFCFSFTVDGYALAILLAILSVYVTVKYRLGFLLGAFLLGASMGIYQAYLPLAILLCVFILILQMFEEHKGQVIIRNSLHMLCMGVLSFVIYLLSLRWMLFVKNESLSGYQGTDRVLSLETVKKLPEGILEVYKDFLRFLFKGELLYNNLFFLIVFLMMALILIFFLIRMVYIETKRKEKVRLFATLGLLVLLPLATSTILLISPNTFYHTLLRYPWMVYYVVTVVLAERFLTTELRSKAKSIYCVAITLIGVLIFQYFITANIIYFNMNERYERTYATAVRISDRMEEMDGYQANTKIAVIGGSFSSYQFVPLEYSYERTQHYFGSYGIVCAYDSEKFAQFFRHYLGIPVETIGEERELEIADTEEFKEMGSFPSKSSMKWFDDVIVIKING